MNAVAISKKQHATPEQVRGAIEALATDDFTRLRHAGAALKFGTEYGSPEALLNEALRRTIEGAMSGAGRRWPLHVPFDAYLFQVMRSLANASVEAPSHLKTDYLDDTFDAETFSPGIDTVLINAEEKAEAEVRAKATVAAIDEYFADDEEVLMILFRQREGESPRQIQQAEGMTQTQYETARKRFRRGLTKLGLAGQRP